MNEEPSFFKLILVCGLVLAAFAFAGRGDYQDALEQENAALKSASHCRDEMAKAKSNQIVARVQP